MASGYREKWVQDGKKQHFEVDQRQEIAIAGKAG
jgi:hypothetical protein